MPTLIANAAVKAELEDTLPGVHLALTALKNGHPEEAARVLRIVDAKLVDLINGIIIAAPSR